MDNINVNIISSSPSSLSLDLEKLTSEDIKALAKQFLAMARLVKKDIEQIEIGTVTEQEEDLWIQLHLLHARLENTGLELYNIALIFVVRVNLKNFNQEIIKSTQALNKATEQIQAIHDSIDKAIQAFEIVLDAVGKLTAGGVFQFADILNPTLKLLELAGVKDLPQL
jgi:hypothetical protein